MSRYAFNIVIIAFIATAVASGQRQMEKLDRGLVAIRQDGDRVFVSWRIFATDPCDITFNLYRLSGNEEAIRLNDVPIAGSNYLDSDSDPSCANAWFVRPILHDREVDASRAFKLPAGAPARPYLSIPLRTPKGYRPNDASVGDLDSDGQYEIVLHQAGRGQDNSRGGITDEPVLDAYKLDGTFLWRINLGRNIREGAHYTQFMVYDLDGDGRAEVACKTADGTVDGTGKILGEPDADYRNARGYILEGPEFLTIFDGRTGAAMATADYIPPRGDVEDWGDDYGNRVDRFLACIAYLDGRRPSLVMCRGYYTRTVLAAWNWRDGRLTHLWTFDSDDGSPGNEKYAGQGNHNLSVADVDGDGRDEIIYGACAVDDDGTGLYTTSLGHGDAMHLSDIDPLRPGLEIWAIHERPGHPYGANLRDAATGEVLWGLTLRDPGRGLAMDIDPRHDGYECWANSSNGLYNCRGEQISKDKPRSCNMGVWWDGDLLREILDGATIAKWQWGRSETEQLLSGRDFDCVSNNGSKANPCLCADILGDWREEVIWRTGDGSELRIFTTTIPTRHRLPALMHDPVYRLGVAWQNVAYNQPAHTGFYLGAGIESAAPFRVAAAPVRNSAGGKKTVSILKAHPEDLRSRPNGGFRITYRWQAVPLEKDYTAFVHFVDRAGRIVLQDDHQPPTPTSEWSGYVQYTRTVPLPQWEVQDKRTVDVSLVQGSYAVYAGLYDKKSGKRPLAHGPGVAEVDERRYQIGVLTVDSNAPIPRPGVRTLDLTGYYLTFDEQFDDLSISAWGPAGPGGTRWIAHTPWYGDFGDARFTDPQPDFPFTVKDGVLRIEARKQDGRWRSGLLSAVDPNGRGFKQQYGYFECKAKFPKGPGTWPAFWLMGLKSLKGLPGNTGPRVNPEIDVVEHYGHWPWRLHYVLHQWGRDGAQSKHEGERFVVFGMEEAFHTYGVMIDEQHITLYFDGVELHRQQTPDSVKTPLFPLVNLALGPGWPTDKTPNPSYMFVDYVRVWQRTVDR